MIKLKSLCFVLTTLLIHIGCTEKIEIDLNLSRPQFVIEGNVSTSGESTVKISKSVNFDESNIFPKVENANVEISDNFGNNEILTETSPGFYYSSSFGGIENRRYSLKVSINDQVLESTSHIPTKVDFDSLIVIKTDVPNIPGVEENEFYHEVRVKFKDPSNSINYYRFVETVNNEILNSFVFDDILTNGNNVTFQLQDFTRELVSGDVYKVEMQCIDEYVFDYFNSFGNTQSGTATPANPYSNILGSELGYFNAHTSEIKQIIIQ